MPLLPGSDHHIISENVRELRNAGHPEDQAIAIALHKAKENWDASEQQSAQTVHTPEPIPNATPGEAKIEPLVAEKPAAAAPKSAPKKDDGFHIIGSKPGTDTKPADGSTSPEGSGATTSLGALATAAAADRDARGVKLEDFKHQDEDPGVKSAHHQADDKFYDEKNRELFYDEKKKLFFRHPK
jgi:hypothetical protein